MFLIVQDLPVDEEATTFFGEGASFF